MESEAVDPLFRHGAAPRIAAECLVADLNDLLDEYEHELTRIRSPLVAGEDRRRWCLAAARSALTEAAERIAAGCPGAGAPAGPPGQAAELYVACELLLASATARIAQRLGADEAIAYSGVILAAIRRFLDPEAGEGASGLRAVGFALADERRRLARELHDRIGGQLAQAYQQLELMQLAAGPATADNAAHLARLGSSLRQAASGLREVTSALRLPQLVEDLEAQLSAWMDYAAAAGADLTVRVGGPGRPLPFEHCDQIYLVLVEAVRNAVAHARAGVIMVDVEIDHADVRASVSDDGVGFDAAQIARSAPGTGLAAMRERAALLDGSLLADSAAGRGTRVRLWAPLNRAAR
jgi:signal transduction histidine kinase